MMAMRKEPERRYASVAEFSADVKAYLEGYPLQARTDSWATVEHFRAPSQSGRSHRRIVRDRVGRIRGRHGRARQACGPSAPDRGREKQFMADMFRSATPDVARGETITARTLLDRGAQRIDQELAAEPQIRASLLETIAEAYASWIVRSVAGPGAPIARSGQQSVRGQESGNVKVDDLLAELYRDKGQYSQAEPLLSKVLDAKRAASGAESPEAAHVMGELGECFYWESKDDAAISLLRQTLAIDRKNGPDYGASTRNYLALTLERKGEFDEAPPSFGRSGGDCRPHPWNQQPGVRDQPAQPR